MFAVVFLIVVWLVRKGLGVWCDFGLGCSQWWSRDPACFLFLSFDHALRVSSYQPCSFIISCFSSCRVLCHWINLVCVDKVDYITVHEIRFSIT